MGSSESRPYSPFLEDWLELTFLKKPEILECYRRFRKINETEVDQNPIEFRVSNDIIIQHFPELTSNPFNQRLCTVFSSRSDGKMSFEDFLDMVSVLSQEAPAELKADWAFKVFAMGDDDKRIDEQDIKKLVRLLTGNTEDLDQQMHEIAKRVIKESDVKESIGLDDFRNLMSKSADFKSNFTLRF